MDMTFRDIGQVILPVKHGKPQKPTQKIIGQDDDEDMDEVFRIAQDAAMERQWQKDLSKAIRHFMSHHGRGNLTVKFKGVPIDKDHGKCDDEVGA